MHRALRLTSHPLVHRTFIRPHNLALPGYSVRCLQPLLTCPQSTRLLFDYHKDPSLVGQVRQNAADFTSDESKMKALFGFANLVFWDAFRSGGDKNLMAMHREWRKSLESMKQLLEADAKSTRSKWTKDEREAAHQLLFIVRSGTSIAVTILGLSVVGLGTLVWIAFIK
ncbi:MAG: hypothetical protein ALECFALPRED_007718 [Alectoria fallacina]|uniref:Uncharacterized protein n=1 Tax=Alectoria fallacina TaxID=1903189 RepID=A0A8H3J0P0_9LECA|nr:MAG: hypothetical protein ALECFALPRED_007718 [Alectoria fallacina]